MFSTTPVQLRRASMAWKPLRYTATRRKNAKVRRIKQLMVDVQLTKKYAVQTKVNNEFVDQNGKFMVKKKDFDVEKDMNRMMRKVREGQPVSVGKTKMIKRDIVDEWFRMQSKKAEF